MRPVIIDLTAAPYHCDPTGTRDCTAALCQALDDAMEPDRQLQLAAIARMSMPGAVAEGPETRPTGVHFHRNAPLATILHLPAGIYRVSGTIGYSWHDHVNSKNGDHLARGIHWHGAGPEQTIIRLDDHCPGFDAPDGRPVIQILRGLKSAVCMQNSVEGLRIETGVGNPGAIGLDFYCNNSGAVRDVTVLSSDGHGIARVAIRSWNSSCALLQRISVSGFQFGVQIRHPRLYTVLEDITVQGQSRSGVLVSEHNVALHRLESRNRVPALTVLGSSTHVVAIDVTSTGDGTTAPAVDVRDGVCLVRDLRTSGHATVIAHRDGFPVATPDVAAWCSHPTWTLFPDQPGGTLRLPIRDTPVPGCGQQASAWTIIDAVGDGIHDDTEAIERALASGARCLRFPQGRFRISRQIRIPATVERLDFCYADLEAGSLLKSMEDRGAFLIGDGAAPLFIERIFTMTGFMGRHRLLEHDGVRTLVLRDLHTQYTWTPDQHRAYLWGYDRWVEQADRDVTRILDAIDAAGLAENTLVVFSSDHGDMCSAHAMTAKVYLYEESVRVPLLMRLPRSIRAGLVVDGPLVSNGLDLLPTLCDYAGIAAPAGLPGRSLRPLAEGKPTDGWRDQLVVQSGLDGGTAHLLRTRTHAYMRYEGTKPAEELFDLREDPGQLRNRAADPALAATLADCRTRLAAWRQANHDLANTFSGAGE